MTISRATHHHDSYFGMSSIPSNGDNSHREVRRTTRAAPAEGCGWEEIAGTVACVLSIGLGVASILGAGSPDIVAEPKFQDLVRGQKPIVGGGHFGNISSPVMRGAEITSVARASHKSIPKADRVFSEKSYHAKHRHRAHHKPKEAKVELVKHHHRTQKEKDADKIYDEMFKQYQKDLKEHAAKDRDLLWDHAELGLKGVGKAVQGDYQGSLDYLGQSLEKWFEREFQNPAPSAP